MTRSGPWTRSETGHLLRDFTEIRVANLSPWRSSKPNEAKRLEFVKGVKAEWRMEQQAALEWVAEAGVVVVAWGSEKLTPFMELSKHTLSEILGDRKVFCWGFSASGDPLHPSPLGRVGKDARRVAFKLNQKREVLS